MKIGNRFVGDGESTFVIAEVGSNHDKKLSQAIEMIDIAGLLAQVLAFTDQISVHIENDISR